MSIKHIWVAFIALFLGVLFIAALPVSTKKEPEQRKVDTQVYTTDDINVARQYIFNWSKKGYIVQHIISQNVSTGYSLRKGDILIIMIK